LRLGDNMVRLGDIVVLNLVKQDKRLLLDGVATSFYKNTCLRSTARAHGYGAK